MKCIYKICMHVNELYFVIDIGDFTVEGLSHLLSECLI